MAAVPPPSSDNSEELLLRRKRAFAAGGQTKVDALRASGRRTAWDRINALVDEDSFVEVDSFVTHRNDQFNLHLHPIEGDGVVCGHGTVDGRRIFCFAQDFSVFGG